MRTATGRASESPTRAWPPRECEFFRPDDRPPPWWVRAWSRIRSLMKARRPDRWSLWDLVTTLLDRVGLTLQTVQVLCVDRSAGRVLILITNEYDSGLSPVQGLRKWAGILPLMGTDRGDVRADARTELREEAVWRAPALARFECVERYREGIAAQFACQVLVVDCQMDELILRAETAEGLACWATIDDAIDWLDNPVLGRVLARYRR